MGYGLRAVRAADGLSAAPFADDSRRIYAVGDVRLGNRDQLRAVLANSGVPLDSDIALIAAAYCRWGHEMAERLIGDFAFVVWDGGKQNYLPRAIASGVRSLVYHQGRGRIFLATEPAQFLPLRDFDRTVDDQTVVDFLSWSYAHYGQTFFRSARALRPGHFLAVKANVVREKEYFHPPQRLTQYARTSDYVEEFRSICALAVKDRLDSRYPIVSHLSGGLDSSSIACLADHLRRDEARAPILSPRIGGVPGQSSRRVILHRRDHPADAIRGPSMGRQPSERSKFFGSTLEHAGRECCIQRRFNGNIEIAQRIGARTILSGDPGDFVTGENGLFNELLLQWKFGTVAQDLVGRGFSEREEDPPDSFCGMRCEEAPALLAAWRFVRGRHRAVLELASPRDVRYVARTRILEPAVARHWREPTPAAHLGLPALDETRVVTDRLGAYAASGGVQMLFPLQTFDWSDSSIGTGRAPSAVPKERNSIAGDGGVVRRNGRQIIR